MLTARSFSTTGVLLGMGWMLLSAPAWAANQGGPGTINYVEGQVRLDGKVLGQNAVGAVDSIVNPGQVLETQQGKAEVLLTPGVFLRLGGNSAIRMDSPELTNTRVAVLRGQAMVEVDELYKENNLQVATDGIATTLLKQGVYGFAASPPKVQVFDGEARVNTGDRQKNVSKGHEAFLASGVLKETKFNRDPADGLYAWSNLRSEYLSEASVASARTYVAAPGGWYGGGWYYNPWFGAYSFLPGDGYLFSPFGWGFYSPAFAFYAPFYGGYYGHGYRGIPTRAVAGVHAAPAFRGGFSGGSGFHGGGGRR